jgi:hypothetical protein
MKISERIASIISFIFHPLLMPSFGLFIIFYSDTTESLLPVEFRKYIYLLVFGGTCVLPLCLVPLYLYWNTISTPYMNNSRERNTPLIFTFFLYLLTIYYLFKLQTHYLNLTIYFIAGCAGSIILNYIINLKWKISLHLTGIGGIIGLIAVMRLLQFTPPLYFPIMAIVAGGILFWARMELSTHSWKQVLAGLATGAGTVSVVVFILNRLLIL